MVHDIFSPPVASRNYAYACIAGYEAARHIDPAYKTLGGQLRGLKDVPLPPSGKEISYELACIQAMLTTCKKFIFSESDIEEFLNQTIKKIENINLPSEVEANSIAYGNAVAKHIMAWADTDNYKQSRSFPKFNIDTQEKGRWRPTPPGYMDAVEPHWAKIRAMLLDSAAQFRPSPPIPFNTDKKSAFMKEAQYVYQVGKDLTTEQKNIANFWDCNPYKLNVIGHAMHATKKISPGGHWIMISGQLSRQLKYDFLKTMEVYTLVSLGIYEGFISCWESKYTSNLIRPESVINEYIDDKWAPLLQTPPFPEHTSGHSVVSNASAVILTAAMGDNIAYIDSTEVIFGLDARSFKSFKDAAAEASLSRLYGGIHYRPAIEMGANQGKKIGEMILSKVKMK